MEGSLQKEQSEQIGPCKHLPSNTVPPYGEVTQLWIAMPKRHQVCEEIESMGKKKKMARFLIFKFQIILKLNFNEGQFYKKI